MRRDDPTVLWAEYQERHLGFELLDEVVDYATRRAPWSHARERFRLVTSRVRLDGSCRLLDAGCGSGTFGLYMALATGCQATLLDYSPQALSFAQEVCRRLSNMYGCEIRADFVRGDLRKLSYRDEFDVVWSEGVVEHWLDEAERLHVIRQKVEAARPGGVVFAVVPNGRNPFYQRWIAQHGDIPERGFTAEELERLMRLAGLDEVEVFGFRAYKSPVQYGPFWRRLKFVGGMLWMLEKALPSDIRRPLQLRFGYELVGVGRRPN